MLGCDFQALLNVDDVFKTRGELFCILKIRDAVSFWWSKPSPLKQAIKMCHKSLYITYIMCD